MLRQLTAKELLTVVGGDDSGGDSSPSGATADNPGGYSDTAAGIAGIDMDPSTGAFAAYYDAYMEAYNGLSGWTFQVGHMADPNVDLNMPMINPDESPSRQ